jgi:hypothetical protein
MERTQGGLASQKQERNGEKRDARKSCVPKTREKRGKKGRKEVLRPKNKGETREKGTQGSLASQKQERNAEKRDVRRSCVPKTRVKRGNQTESCPNEVKDYEFGDKTLSLK